MHKIKQEVVDHMSRGMSTSIYKITETKTKMVEVAVALGNELNKCGWGVSWVKKGTPGLCRL